MIFMFSDLSLLAHPSSLYPYMPVIHLNHTDNTGRVCVLEFRQKRIKSSFPDGIFRYTRYLTHTHALCACFLPDLSSYPSPTHTYRGSHRHTQRIIHRRLAMWESDVFRRKSKNNKDCLKRSMFPWKLPVLPQLLMQWAARGRLGIGRGSENFAPAGTVEEKRGNWCTCKKSGEKELPQNPARQESCGIKWGIQWGIQNCFKDWVCLGYWKPQKPAKPNHLFASYHTWQGSFTITIFSDIHVTE